MPKIAYIERNFTPSSLDLIKSANAIIGEYQRKGFALTLRQLYYQFVARDLLKNTMREYKRLGSVVNDGRMAGLIDWSAIEDRTRNLETRTRWDSPAQIIEATARSFHMDMWQRQDYRPEVWVEKEALIGVVERVCREFDVPYFACRGYTSQSEQWAAGVRLGEYADNGQTPIILHLGDHDPSGIDMTRDNAERLTTFAGRRVEVRRLALNMAQIEELKPPPNPAKITDSRFEGYEAIHGGESWELDALPPEYIEALIRGEVESLIDGDQWGDDEATIEEGKDLLKMASDNWADVRRYLKENF